MLQRLVASFCRIEGVRSATLLDSSGLHLAGVISGEGGAPVLDAIETGLNRAEAVAAEHGLGAVDQLWLESTDGHLLLARMAAGHTLFIESDGSPNLGRLRYEVERARPAFAQMV